MTAKGWHGIIIIENGSAFAKKKKENFFKGCDYMKKDRRIKYEIRRRKRKLYKVLTEISGYAVTQNWYYTKDGLLASTRLARRKRFVKNFNRREIRRSIKNETRNIAMTYTSDEFSARNNKNCRYKHNTEYFYMLY